MHPQPPIRIRRGAGAPGVVFGLLIVAAGVLLLLDNLNILYIGDAWRYWPVALMALGAAKIFNAQGGGGRIWGGILAIGGVLFLLRNFGHIPFPVVRLWPLLVIGFGASLLWRALERRGSPACHDKGPSISRVNEWVVFGGAKRQSTSQNFEGGEALAIFGGIEIDLRGASIQNDQVILDANAMFGGIELRVPDTWNVTVKGVGIFGGYEDKSVPPRDGARPQNLVVTGYAIFGGVEVKN